MAKTKTVYVCSECGMDSPKWVGRCPSCGAWNTMKQMTIRPEQNTAVSERQARQELTGVSVGRTRAIPLSEVSVQEEPRISTYDAELDRVLGGGIVPG